MTIPKFSSIYQSIAALEHNPYFAAAITRAMASPQETGRAIQFLTTFPKSIREATVPFAIPRVAPPYGMAHRLASLELVQKRRNPGGLQIPRELQLPPEFIKVASKSVADLGRDLVSYETGDRLFALMTVWVLKLFADRAESPVFEEAFHLLATQGAMHADPVIAVASARALFPQMNSIFGRSGQSAVETIASHGLTREGEFAPVALLSAGILYSCLSVYPSCYSLEAIDRVAIDGVGHKDPAVVEVSLKPLEWIIEGSLCHMKDFGCYITPESLHRDVLERRKMRARAATICEERGLFLKVCTRHWEQQLRLEQVLRDHPELTGLPILPPRKIN